MNSLEARIGRLTPQQRQVLAESLEQEVARNLIDTLYEERAPEASGRQQLVAYVSTDQGNGDFTQLRQHAEQNLPDYMRPAVYIEIDAMPKLDNGKVNYAALPDPRLQRDESSSTSHATEDTSSDTDTQSSVFVKLMAILAELIGMDDIRAGDNFFEIGGDSITAIQLVSRAREAGIQLSVANITSAPDLGSLAASVQSTSIRQSDVSAYGVSPLTPIQSWFFSHSHPHPEQWNLGGVMTFRQAVNAKLLAEAIIATIKSHPAISTRFQQHESHWSAVVQDDDPPAHLVQVMLEQPEVSEDDYLQRLQASFRLDVGWLAGFIITTETTSGSDSDSDDGSESNKAVRLFWAMHHLICDGLSIQVVLDAIRSAYQQLEQSGSIRTATPQPSSYREWALAMQTLRSEKLQHEIQAGDVLVPAESATTPVNLREDACMSLCKIIDGPMLTALATANEAYGTTTHELVLAALAYAWTDVSGNSTAAFDIETHGRDALGDEFDNSGIVGWYTSYFPFEAELAHKTDVGAFIKNIKDLYRQQQQQHSDYLLMRYGEQPQAPEVDLLPAGSVNLLFNFINYTATGGGVADAQFWNAETVSPDVFRSPSNNRSHLIELNTVATPERLTFNFRIVQERVEHILIENLFQAMHTQLQAIVNHCNAAETAGYTPADFPDLDMAQADLDDFLKDIGIN
jgi:non-ribosomal peptide synthase protein (TIGR01720 family)